MTLKDVITVLEAAASSQPAVNCICREDVFRINNRPDVRYGVFAWLQRTHRADIGDGWNRFAFTLFYVDRLTHSGRNLVDIQSTGIEVLRNILLTVEGAGVYLDGEATFDTFRQRFVDECAGVFCQVTFQVNADSVCPEDFVTGNNKMTI